jgi:hypothetical protein
MRVCFLSVHCDLVLAALDHRRKFGVLVAAPEQILQLFGVHEFVALLSIILDHEESRVRYCLGRGQELALLLDMLTVSTWQGTRAVGLFAVDTFYKLVQVKGD